MFSLNHRLTPTLAAIGLFLCLISAVRGQQEPSQLATNAPGDRMLARSNSHYDPVERMIRRPFSSRGYHTTLVGGLVHPTRDSLYYALELLDSRDPAYLDRAVGIIQRVVSLQDTRPDSSTYGVWSYYLEEPLEQMSPPDWNWADFNGVSLLQIVRDHRDKLPADLATAVDAAIVHACRAIKKRNVPSSYTNIAIMGAYVTTIAGEQLGLPEFLDYGLERIQRFADYTRANGTLEEYNSPMYTVIALTELTRLRAHIQSDVAKPALDELIRLAWVEIAQHFHAPTRQWAGPNSRAYSSLLVPKVLALIQRGIGGRVVLTDYAEDEAELRIPFVCPPDLVDAFGPLTEPRSVVKTFIKRTQTIGTTYLHPDFALGSINRGDLWNQRRALLLHFGTVESPGYLHLRFLKNGYDFASANLSSAQKEGVVAGAINLVTNGGDTHISLQMVKGGRIKASDIRVRFELGGPAGLAAETELTSAAAARIDAAGLAVYLNVVRARFGEVEGRLVTGANESTRWIDVVLYEGAEQEFELAALEEAVVGFVLSVGSPAPVATAIENERLVVTSGDLSTSVRIRPSRR